MIDIRSLPNPILLLSLLLFSNLALAQHQCATPHPTASEQRAFMSRLGALPKQSARRASKQAIPARFHIVRRDDGTGGAYLSSLNQALVLMNQHFHPAGIYFLCLWWRG